MARNTHDSYDFTKLDDEPVDSDEPVDTAVSNTSIIQLVRRKLIDWKSNHIPYTIYSISLVASHCAMYRAAMNIHSADVNRIVPGIIMFWLSTLSTCFFTNIVCRDTIKTDDNSIWGDACVTASGYLYITYMWKRLFSP